MMGEAEKIFEKKYTCPVCENQFTAKTVKSGRAKLLRTDMDLRNTFDGIEPLKYEVVLCQNCGYGALAKFFPTVGSVQRKLIKEKITPNFKLIPEEGDTYTYEQALARYNVALANAVVKMAKVSEGAYICLKIGWLCRSYKESLDKAAADYQSHYEKLDAMEKTHMQKAYKGFIKAVQSEEFPMCGMDESTMNYLLAVLAMEEGDYGDSTKLLSQIITSSAASSRVKDRAREVKEELSKRMKETE